MKCDYYNNWQKKSFNGIMDQVIVESFRIFCVQIIKLYTECYFGLIVDSSFGCLFFVLLNYPPPPVKLSFC